MEVIAMIRSRIGFFAISKLFDKVEIKQAESIFIQKIQERHTFRIQQLEKTIELLFNKILKIEK